MKKLFLYFTFSIAGFLAFGQVNLNKGLVAYFPFHGNANDSSINANNGTVTGATLSSDRNNVANDAYSFFTGSKIVVPASSAYNFANMDSFTFSVWIRPSGIDPIGSKLIDFYTSVGYYDLSIAGGSGANAGKIVFSNFDGINTRFEVYSDSIIKLNIWQHVLVEGIKSQNTVRMYMNGRMVSQTTAQHYSLTNPALTIGNDVNGTSSMRGVIDDVRIYRRILSFPERNLMADIVIPDFRKRGQLAYYPLDGGLADDTIAPHANGTLFGLLESTNRFATPSKALYFGAATARISVPKTAKFDFLAHDSFSLSLWVRPLELNTGNAYFLNIFNSAKMDLFMLGSGAGADSGKVQFQNFDGLHPGEFLHVTSDSALLLYKWQNIVVTVDKLSAVTRLFVNGRLTGQVPMAPFTVDTASLTIGNNAAFNSAFKGSMDEVQIIGRLLSASEIAAMFDITYVGLNQLASNEVSLLVYPNPSAGIFHLHSSLDDSYKIRINNISGQTVYEDQYMETLNLAHLSKGLYLMQVLSKDGAAVINKKILIE